jgi:hypothetical protein
MTTADVLSLQKNIQLFSSKGGKSTTGNDINIIRSL